MSIDLTSARAIHAAEAAPPSLTAGDGEEGGPGLVGQNIICFAKDWSEDPTSCNHVLRELARDNRVLWLNSISTRAPSLSSGRDLRKILHKLMACLRGPVAAQKNLWVYTPLVLPYHHNERVAAVNRWLLRTTIRTLRRRLGMDRFQLWTFVPTSAEYAGAMGEDRLIYYCTDNWAQFSAVDGEKIGGMVEALARKADVVFATSHLLVEGLSRFNRNTHLSSHGVSYDLFARAVQDETRVPPDLAALPGPVLGYYGLIEDWLDQELIAHLAERHPEWTVVLVGRVCVDTSRLQRLANVHFLGRKPHEQLPNYCKGFDVGLIPHKVNELTTHMNPIKLREYMSAGLPIVSTALPEMRRHPDQCTVAENYLQFEHAVAEAVATDSLELRRARSAKMSSETWDRKVLRLGQIIRRVPPRGKQSGEQTGGSDGRGPIP